MRIRDVGALAAAVVATLVSFRLIPSAGAASGGLAAGNSHKTRTTGAPALARLRASSRRPLPADVLDARTRSKEEAGAILHASTAPTPPAQWTSIGPSISHGGSPDPVDADAGRLVSVVVDSSDSQIVYVAAAGGGVWKTTNADPAVDDWNWTPLTDTLTAASSDGSIAPGALVMSPTDHLTLYLGMGDPYVIGPASRGVYVTHDGGATWSLAPGILGTTTHVRDMLALGASTLLVSTDTGLWISTNGAATFVHPNVPGETDYQAWSIRKLTDTDLVLAVQSNASQQGALYWSADAGWNWTIATVTGEPGQLGRVRLDTAPDASTTAVRGVYEDLSTYSTSDSAAVGTLRSNDGGKSYTFLAAPTGAGSLFQGEQDDGGDAFYALLITIDPTDPTKIFAGTNFAFYRSTDDGATWTQLSEWAGYGHAYLHADLHCATWYGGALYVGNDGGLAVVRDPYRASPPVNAGGGPVTSDPTFIDNRHNKGLTTDLLYTVGSTNAAVPTDARNLVSAGAQDNGILVRVAGSGGSLATSTTWFQGMTGDGFGTVVHPIDPSKILASVYTGYFFKSEDGGQSFQQSTTGLPLNDEAFFTHLVPAWTDKSGDTLLHDSTTQVYRTTNFGDSWSALGTPPDASATLIAIAASHRSGATIAVSAANHSGYITHDAGATWTKFGALPDAGSLYPGYDDATGIWIDTHDDATVYVTSESARTDKSHLWRSRDGGVTFEKLDAAGNGLPTGLPVYAVQNDPRSSAVLYAATELGVYRSADDGATWTRYGMGLPLVAVRDLWLAPDGSRLRAATYGRAMWEAPLAYVAPHSTHGGCRCSLDASAATTGASRSIVALAATALVALAVARRRAEARRA
ncbi:MAG TPA: hypothetical protein VMV18_00775 [bacterium]|nr:hypothetical protein [bacterium]